jgi:omega-6 fatty acid desaturase (delta-12 desaturase)
VLQLITLTPVPLWRSNHLAHHRRFGDLGTRDIADTIFFTRRQFEEMPSAKRRFWRIARSPILFFGLLPFVQWAVEYPFLAGNAWLWTGLVLHGIVIWKLSIWHAVTIYLSTLMGLSLFHLQHGIGPGYRAPPASWRFEHAALLGSTWVRVPWPLTWCTLGIEFHHVHHLHPGVPSYSLARCNAEAPIDYWSDVTTGGWRNCAAAFKHVMWDDDRGRLSGF